MNKKSGFYKNGKSHADGGIPVLVDDNTLIEVEKFEYVICNNAMNSTKIFEFKDKTNKEILDEIFRYSDCEFEQHKANSGDFIICKLAVMDKKKRNITGTAKEIINVMQSEKSCNVSNDSKEFKDGGEVNDETYTKWKNLVNMSKSELENFYDSKDGKEAGLSSSEAKEQGISSGRESARWIMKMKDTPKSEWTPTMWKWAKKQISFISRMSGMKGDLYDDNGNKTRKHTSLLIWGHNPEKYKDGGSILEKRDLTYIGEVGGHNLQVDSDLELAKRMYNRGESKSKILEKTGWFLNPFDNIWRYEISDKDFSFKVDFDKIYDYIIKTKAPANSTLGEIIKHDKLFKAYPEFKDIIVIFIYDENKGIASISTENKINLTYNFYGERIYKRRIDSNGLYIREDKFDRRKRQGVFAHEIQHIIQIREGMGGGSSILWQYGKLLKERKIDGRTISEVQRNILLEEAEKLNLNSSGEIESMDVEKRIDLSEEDRKNIEPLSLIDFDEKYINIRLEDKDNFKMNNGGELNNEQSKRKFNTNEITVFDETKYDDNGKDCYWKTYTYNDSSISIDYCLGEFFKIDAIGTKEKSRRSGDASKLIDYAKGIALQNNFDKIDVYLPIDENTPRKEYSLEDYKKAVSFYKKNGFEFYTNSTVKMFCDLNKILKNGAEKLNANVDCEKYIKEHENVFKNGYYSFVKNISIYADSYGGKIPKIDSLIIISYNSGGQNNLKVTDTINSIILQKKIGELIEEENGIPKIIISKHLLNAKRVNEDIFNLIKNNNVVIIDRDEVACSNLTNKKILKNGGELKTNEMENKENKIGNIFEFNSKVFNLILKPISEKYKFNIIKKEGKSSKEPYYELVSNNNSEIKRSGFINSYFQKNKNIDTYSITGNLFIEFIDNNDLHERIPIHYEFIDNNVDFNNAYSEIDKQFNEYEQTYLSFKKLIKIESENKETLQGGKADKLTIEDIANKHNVSVEYAKEQLNKGMKIESEHTKDTEKQKEIALDHLSEFIEYYKELDKMEEKLKIMENKEINTPNVTNWNQVPKVWKNTKEIKKVNFINSPYNKDLIKLLTPFAGDDSLRPIMSGIHFDENGITVTDAHKLVNLPYPNKDFNGTYATIPKKFLKDEKSIENDLFSSKYPNYKVVIPESDKAERVQDVSVYKLLQYTEVALHYASQSSKQIAFSLGDIRYGLNGEFLIEVLELALKLGHKKLYAFTTLANRAIVFSDNKNYELGKDLIFLQMPVMLLDDYDHEGKKYENQLGAHDLDWDRAITVYYDFSKDAIINEDGSIAEFKMNYGEYDVINPNEINILKKFEGKNNFLPILDYFKVQGNKIIAANLNQSFITIKKVNLKDGLYQIRDNAVEFDPTFTLSSYEEYPMFFNRSEKRLEFSINSDVLLHYVKIALDYVGHDDLRPVMSGILFDYVDGKLFIVATDAHKLLKINITRFVNIEKQDNFQFILSTINLLKVLDNINESVLTVKATKELAIIENDEFEFESRLIDGKYPAYNQVISAFKNKKLTINIKDLFTCIKSKEAESFVKSNKGEDILIYDKLKNESELSINLGFLESGYSKDRKIEKSVEICKVDYKLENGDYQTKDNLVLLMPIMGVNEEHFIFKYKFFNTVLETLNCENVELFYDEKNRAYIFGGDCFGYESTILGKKKETVKPKTETKKEQSNEQKEFLEAINTFEELIKLGGTDAEMKEWQEAIETFKMLLDDEPTKYAKGGNVEKQHSDLEKEIMESQFGNLD